MELTDDLKDLIQNDKNLQASYNKNQFVDVVSGRNDLPDQVAKATAVAQPIEKQISDSWDASISESLWGTGSYALDLIRYSDVDPGFKASDHPELFTGIDEMQHSEINKATSYRMAGIIKDRILEQSRDTQILKSQGFVGSGVSLLAGLVDPVNLATIAVPEFSLAAKIGGAGRVAGMARGAVANAEFAAVAGSANVLTSPTGRWTDVADSVVEGLKFGAVLGATGLLNRDPTLAKVDEHLDSMQREMHEFADTEAHNAPEPGTKVSPAESFSKADSSFTVSVAEDGKVTSEIRKMDTEGSIGAGYIPAEGEVFDPELAQPETLRNRTESRTFLAERGLGEKADNQFPDTVTGRIGRKFQEHFQKTPLAPYFDRFWNSGSMILRKAAYQLQESASGIVRNNTSGAVIKEVYINQLLEAARMHEFETNLAIWAKDNGMLDKTSGPMAWRILDPALRDKFSRAIQTELKTRRYNAGLASAEERGIHPAVAAVADNIDQSAAKSRTVLQSEDGLSPVKGSEHLYDGPGYFPQLMNGQEIVNLKRKGVKLAQIQEGIVNALKKMYPEFSPEALLTTAKAYMTRARSISEGLDTNMYRMMSQDGELFVRQFLANSGHISAAEVDKMLQSLRVATSDKEKAGFMRHRLELDTSTPIPGTEFTLMDLMHRDVPEVWSRYCRQVAGAAAMARHGYQYAEKERWKNLVMDELHASGNQNHGITEDMLDDMWSHFGGGPVNGAPGPMTRRILSTVALSVYGGMGLWQATEAAAGMAAFGMTKYIKELKVAMKKDDGMTKQVQHLVAGVIGEEKLYNEKFHYDMFQRSQSGYKIVDDVMQVVDRALAAGRDIQGALTGFYKIRQIEQKAAIRCMLWSLADTFDGINAMSPARLEDIGMDAKTANKIKQYFVGDRAIVERTLDENGVPMLNLHLEAWHPNDELALGAVLNRSVNQVVQKAMAGETIPWIHKGVAAIMMQGKGFTMNSISKQFIRNAKFGDHSMYNALGYGMMTGTAGYMASQLLAGNTDNLDPIKLVKGGIANSNMSGWIPGFWDVPMSMLGWNSLSLSPYGISPRSDVIGVPPLFTSLNNLAHLPAVPFDAAAGNWGGQDRAALKALPIIGNLPYTKGLWNSLD